MRKARSASRMAYSANPPGLATSFPVVAAMKIKIVGIEYMCLIAYLLGAVPQPVRQTSTCSRRIRAYRRHRRCRSQQHARLPAMVDAQHTTGPQGSAPPNVSSPWWSFRSILDEMDPCPGTYRISLGPGSGMGIVATTAVFWAGLLTRACMLLFVS